MSSSDRERSEGPTDLLPLVTNPVSSKLTSPASEGPRFELLEELGRGGMARVLRVHDRLLKREVALKILDASLTEKPTEVERFAAEARITALLEHPNVVPVHDLFVGAAPQFLMKLVGGQSLDRHLELFPLPRTTEALDELLGIFRKVCDAVAYAHSRGVVHRDLKAPNVMVDVYGQVYVVDWGLARLADETGNARGQEDYAGTPSYMAPEQVHPSFGKVGFATDVFALGAMLYEILTGRTPYVGDEPNDLRLQAARSVIPPPETIRPGVPPGLARIAMKAMSKAQKDRHASVVELARDVDRFLRGGGATEVRTFEDGQIVVHEGAPGDEAFVIVAGRCRAFKSAGGKKLVLREMGPGDVFGEMAILAGRARTASVEAIERLTVRVVPRAVIAEGLGLHTWMGAFVRALAERFVEVDARATQLEVLLDRRKNG